MLYKGRKAISLGVGLMAFYLVGASVLHTRSPLTALQFRCEEINRQANPRC